MRLNRNAMYIYLLHCIQFSVVYSSWPILGDEMDYFSRTLMENYSLCFTNKVLFTNFVNIKKVFMYHVYLYKYKLFRYWWHDNEIIQIWGLYCWWPVENEAARQLHLLWGRIQNDIFSVLFKSINLRKHAHKK